MMAENEARGLNGMADRTFYRVGVIGTGMISGTYIDTMAKRFDIIRVEAIADIATSKRHGGLRRSTASGPAPSMSCYRTGASTSS